MQAPNLVYLPFASNLQPVEALFPETVRRYFSQREEAIGDARCTVQYTLTDAAGKVRSDETESYDDVEDALSFLNFYLSMICLNSQPKWTIVDDSLKATDEDGGVTRMKISKIQPEADNG